MHTHQTPVGGVNATPPVPSIAGDQGAKGTLQSRVFPDSSAGDTCASDGILLPLEDPEPCGHIIEIGKGMVCIRGLHPGNPRGHVYVSSNGSHVLDKHQGAS